MKILARLSVLSLILAGGCALPQLSQQDVQTIVTAAQQAQELYHTVQPLVEQIAGKEPLYERGKSPKWDAVRDKFIAEHPLCSFCSEQADEVHHIQPFHLNPELELDESNLISLCRRHHFLWGHCGNWKDFNPGIRTDAELWRAILLYRETRETKTP